MMALYRTFVLIATLTALMVVALGAYTRLSDAGLGCPDWPGCYGQLFVPTESNDIAKANALYPQAQVDIPKAYKEMIHRYFAGTLGLLVLGLGLGALFKRKTISIPLWLPCTLMILIIGQALLGMWTVTLKLLPLVVLAHLIGGLSTLSLLWVLYLYTRPKKPLAHAVSRTLPKLAFLVTACLIVQIILGGWTSANYAALICPDFPMCQGQWWPAFSAKAFNLFGGIGLPHPLSYMNSAEKTSIHMMHRLGALITFSLGIALCWFLFRNKSKKMSLVILTLLLTQVCLGIMNVTLSLPLHNAVAHHFVAALLLLTLLTLDFALLRRDPHGQ